MRISDSDLPEWERDLLEKQTVAGERISPRTEQQTPAPIDPADIRPGDVVERRKRVNVLSIEGEAVITDQGGRWYFHTPGWTWHLVHRPDPDAEVVDSLILAASTGSDGEPDYGNTTPEKILARLRESGWDVVRRAES